MNNISPLLSNLLDIYQQRQLDEEDDDDDYLDELPANANKFANVVNIIRKTKNISKRSKSEHQFRGLNGTTVPKRMSRFSIGGKVQPGWGGPFGIGKTNCENDKDGGNSEGGGNRWLSVLTPENRDFLKNQGKKSPETVPRTLVIGESSFRICKNGEIISEADNLSSSPTEALSSLEEKENINYQTDDREPLGNVKSLDRKTSVESNSDSSCFSGSAPNLLHKRAQRHPSVWSMASSVTSIDSNEEEREEQLKLFNLQISRNRNNRKEEVMREEGFEEFREPTLNEKWKAAVDGTLGILLQSYHKRRTSTPNRNRTQSSSSGPSAPTISEASFFSNGEGTKTNSKGRRPPQPLHQSSSFPLSDSKGEPLRGIRETSDSGGCMEDTDGASLIPFMRQRGKLERQKCKFDPSLEVRF